MNMVYIEVEQLKGLITDEDFEKVYKIAYPLAICQKSGHWRDISGQATLCSCCGRESNAKQAKTWSYCPYCWAKMEEMK